MSARGSKLRSRAVRRRAGAVVCAGLAAILFTQTFSAAVAAQQLPDCSDPLEAGSAECAAAMSQGQSLTSSQGLTYSQIQSQAQMGQSGATGVPAESYTDLLRTNQQRARAMQPDQGAQMLLPPQPLTEFQKFVASTTGEVLPIFGADLFRRVPSTFAPLNMAVAPSNYVIGPGDVLRIRVWGQVSFQVNLEVDRSGEVFVPQVGPVHVEGLRFSELSGHLRAAIGRVYRNFDLTVDVGQVRSIQVYVTGQARRPGVYTVSALSTLVDALFAAGGPSVEGSLRHIELLRGAKTVADFDLYDLLVRGDKSRDVKLAAGDVLFIPPAGAEVALTGSVRTPGIYELRGAEPLSAVLAYAGGETAMASGARISIERIEDRSYRQALEVSDNTQGLATKLAQGDLIRVYPVLPAYRKTVILRGHMANPGRYAWHAGMRLSDLIPDKNSLLTRTYWWRRAQLGLPAPEFQPEMDLENRTQPTGAQSAAAGNQTGTRGNLPARSTSYETSPYGPAEVGQMTRNQAGSGQAAPETGQTGFGTEQNPSARQQAGGMALAAANSQMTTRMASGQVPTEVKLLAPEIDWNYAVIERLDPETLKTQLIPFDLGKLVNDHDASQNLELEPGDVVTIFSEADIRVPEAQQTKLVRLDGEIAHAGVYLVRPGETLRSLVERAGGLTPQAYLYGSEFTRQSTRAIQQARIDEYVHSLSMQIQRENLALVATGSTQNQATATAEQTSESGLIASLLQTRATGRIVLPFRPEDRGPSTIPVIALQDGDHFTVPPTPETVNVVGAVYDQNSFLYAPGRRLGVYLREAGGPNRTADRRHAFVIRADGEVVSHDALKPLWANGFDDLRMYPGDTLVVPEKTYKLSAMRGVMEWSQLFSQFALGAAALTLIP